MSLEKLFLLVSLNSTSLFNLINSLYFGEKDRQSISICSTQVHDLLWVKLLVEMTEDEWAS